MLSLAGQLSWISGYRWRERAHVIIVFSFVPTVLFWVWYILEARHGIQADYSDLAFSMPVSSLWITFGPVFMQQWEYNVRRLVRALVATQEAGGWPLADLNEAIRRVDRRCYPMSVSFAFAASIALWVAYPNLAKIITIRGFVAALGGVIVIFCVGFTSACGVWAAYKSLTIVRVVTRRAEPVWRPFRSEQPSGIHEIYLFSWTTAVMFSAGSVFLPSLIVVQKELPVPAKLIVLVFAGMLLLGGLVLFTVPNVMLYRLGKIQKARALDRIAPSIEKNMDVLDDLDHESVQRVRQLKYSLDIALSLRTEIVAQTPFPILSVLTRAATTMILPILITVFQAAVTKALQ
jgi:hypothetical protein